MLRRHNHEGYAEQRVRSGGIDLQLLVCAVHGEIHEGAGGLADPADLLLLDAVRIIHFVESVQKLVRILGNPEIPDILRQLYHFAVADIALSALGVLVGENHLAVRAVVHQGLCSEHQAVLEQLQENPLGPLVIIRKRRGDLSAPVKGEAHTLHLILEMLHIAHGDDVRVGIGLDGVVFRRKSKGIKSDGEQDVVALHSSLAGNNFDTGIGLDVSYMHACSGRIGELHQSVKLRFFTEIHGFEYTGVIPCLLPLRFDSFEIVFHNCNPLLYL